MCNISLIQGLFGNGSSFVVYPFRVVYLISPCPQGVPAVPKILISVPKRRFKLAVKRNRLKRLVREAYRLEKTEFHQKLAGFPSVALSFAIQYIGAEELPIRELRAKIRNVFSKIERELHEKYATVDTD